MAYGYNGNFLPPSTQDITVDVYIPKDKSKHGFFEIQTEETTSTRVHLASVSHLGESPFIPIKTSAGERGSYGIGETKRTMKEGSSYLSWKSATEGAWDGCFVHFSVNKDIFIQAVNSVGGILSHNKKFRNNPRDKNEVNCNQFVAQVLIEAKCRDNLVKFRMKTLTCIFHERHASPGQKPYNNWLSKGF